LHNAFAYDIFVKTRQLAAIDLKATFVQQVAVKEGYRE